MAEILEPELCVIGSGPGAIAAAVGAAAGGARVILVRHGPSSFALKLQALLTTADRFQAIRDCAPFGIRAGAAEIDFGHVRTHVHAVSADVARNETALRLSALGIRVIEGAPCFTGPNVLAIGDDVAIKARHFVIAMGSSPVPPAIEGLDGEFLTPEALLNRDELPESLVIIGGTPEGLELAQAFLRFGVTVSVIVPGEFLPGEDTECAAVLLQRLRAAGLAIHLGQPIRAVRAGNVTKIAVEKSGQIESVAASHVAVADGRRAELQPLGLDMAGISVGSAGVTVDDFLLSSNARVSAIGEAIGAASVQAARRHAAIVVQNALHHAKLAADPDVIPRVIFTDPGLAHVGLTEDRARSRASIIRVLRGPFQENDRALAEHACDGHIKIVTAADGTILGATIVGRGAADQVASFALAVERGLGVHDLSGWVVPYPSRLDAGKLALTGAEVSGLTSPRSGSIISLLRRRG